MTQLRETPTAYVAGPVTGLPDANRQAFQVAEDILAADGWDVINPTAKDASDETLAESKALGDRFAKGEAYQAIMKECIADVLGADALFALPGWRNSAGATLEVLIAIAIGLPVFEAPTAPIRPPFAGGIEMFVDADQRLPYTPIAPYYFHFDYGTGSVRTQV